MLSFEVIITILIHNILNLTFTVPAILKSSHVISLILSIMNLKPLLVKLITQHLVKSGSNIVLYPNPTLVLLGISLRLLQHSL